MIQLDGEDVSMSNGDLPVPQVTSVHLQVLLKLLSDRDQMPQLFLARQYCVYCLSLFAMAKSAFQLLVLQF